MQGCAVEKKPEPPPAPKLYQWHAEGLSGPTRVVILTSSCEVATEEVAAEVQSGARVLEGFPTGLDPATFEDDERGVVMNEFGEATIVRTADVPAERLVVHDEHRPDPALAFALSRLAERPDSPTPVGVFRAVERPTYEGAVQQQLVDASERSGPGDLGALLRSAPTWTVS